MEIKAQNLFADDEIDLREVVRVLARHKWLILITTLSVTLIAFIINQFFITQIYNSSAVVAINRLDLLFSEAIISGGGSPNLFQLSCYDSAGIPKTKEISEFANATEVVANLPDLDSSVKLDMKVEGGDLIRLAVTTPDPGQAERLADEWSLAFISYLDHECILSPIQQLETALDASRGTLNSAEEKLSLAFSETQISDLEIQYELSKTMLINLLERKQNNQAKIAAAQILIERFADQNDSDVLSAHQSLSILELYLSEAGLAIVLEQLQEGYTTGQARADLTSLVELLQESNLEYARQIESAEDEVMSNRIQLDQAKNEVGRYAIERDFALKADLEFQARIQPQLTSLQNIVEQNEAVAVILTRPEKPEAPVQPDVFSNTALVGAVGMVAAMGGVIVFETWKPREEEGGE